MYRFDTVNVTAFETVYTYSGIYRVSRFIIIYIDSSVRKQFGDILVAFIYLADGMRHLVALPKTRCSNCQPGFSRIFILMHRFAK